MGCGYIVTGDTESSSDLKEGCEECPNLKPVIYQKSMGEKPVAKYIRTNNKINKFNINKPLGKNQAPGITLLTNIIVFKSLKNKRKHI